MSSRLPVYFATMTGNAENLAGRLADRAKKDGWNAVAVNLADVKPAALTKDTFALFVISTWGDGEPPADATDFHDALGTAALDLSALRYAVFGLGDHDYPEFNAFARQLDERLQKLGATPIDARVEVGVTYDDAYDAWEGRIVGILAEHRASVG